MTRLSWRAEAGEKEASGLLGAASPGPPAGSEDSVAAQAEEGHAGPWEREENSHPNQAGWAGIFKD